MGKHSTNINRLDTGSESNVKDGKQQVSNSDRYKFLAGGALAGVASALLAYLLSAPVAWVAAFAVGVPFVVLCVLFPRVVGALTAVGIVLTTLSVATNHEASSTQSQSTEQSQSTTQPQLPDRHHSHVMHARR